MQLITPISDYLTDYPSLYGQHLKELLSVKQCHLDPLVVTEMNVSVNQIIGLIEHPRSVSIITFRIATPLM